MKDYSKMYLTYVYYNIKMKIINVCTISAPAM